MFEKLDTYDLILEYARACAAGSRDVRDYETMVDTLRDHHFISMRQYNLIYNWMRRLYYWDYEDEVKDTLTHQIAMRYDWKTGEYEFTPAFSKEVVNSLYV